VDILEHSLLALYALFAPTLNLIRVLGNACTAFLQQHVYEQLLFGGIRTFAKPNNVLVMQIN